ncbi:MAG TPA: cytochrome c oxidase subunit II [Micropepsaceae bacterium]
MQWIPFFTPGDSQYSNDVDLLFVGLLTASVLMLVLLFGLMLIFIVRFRENSGVKRPHPAEKSWRWEIAWTSATALIFVIMFAWGASLYVRIYRPPDDALTINVVAKQWMWKAEHPGGQMEINALHVPVGRAIRLIMASQDVIHSFFVPAFRLKHDVVPGRFQSLWFTALRPGTFQLFCAEYCGTDHSRMTGSIVVLRPAEYQDWLRDQVGGDTLAAEGASLFRSLGCSGCHAPGSTVHAPRLEGVYGNPVPLSDGTIVPADDRYIRDSILQPRSQIAAGYEPIMPVFAGQISEDELLRLVAYIKSLANAKRGAQ